MFRAGIEEPLCAVAADRYREVPSKTSAIAGLFRSCSHNPYHSARDLRSRCPLLARVERLKHGCILMIRFGSAKSNRRDMVGWLTISCTSAPKVLHRSDPVFREFGRQCARLPGFGF